MSCVGVAARVCVRACAVPNQIKACISTKRCASFARHGHACAMCARPPACTHAPPAERLNTYRSGALPPACGAHWCPARWTGGRMMRDYTDTRRTSRSTATAFLSLVGSVCYMVIRYILHHQPSGAERWVGALYLSGRIDSVACVCACVEGARCAPATPGHARARTTLFLLKKSTRVRCGEAVYYTLLCVSLEASRTRIQNQRGRGEVLGR